MNVPYVSPERLLAEYGELIRPIKGVSMLPLLCEQSDAVRLVHLEAKPEVGDIVLFRRENGQYVLHRIAEDCGDYFLIRGDNCIEFEKVPVERVIARSAGYYKNGTYVSVLNEDYLAYTKRVLERGKPLEEAGNCYFGSRKKEQRKYRLARIFPGYVKMKKMYPVLNIFPVMLPLFWIVRLISCLINGGKRRAAINEFSRWKNKRTDCSSKSE